MNFPERKFMNRNGVLHLLLLFVCMFSMTVGTMAQTAKSGVMAPEGIVPPPTPVTVGGNPTCRDLNRSTDPAFAHIVEDWGFKIDRASPFNGTFQFVTAPSQELQGGLAADPLNSVTVTATGNTLNWSSTRLITAVIVKAGPEGSNVYPYPPSGSFGGEDGGGIGLITPDGSGVSHVVFCVGLPAGPSAAPASAGGRVLDSYGRGISGARMTVQNATTGETFTTYTSPFGYYNFVDLESPNFYFLTISSKRYTFANNMVTFSLDDNLTNLDFVATP